MRNHEVTKRQPLLDGRGHLTEPGWARSQVWEYKRKEIKAPAFRIKEWDYYLVMGDGFATAFTISDDGYIGLQSVSFLDFKTPMEQTKTILTPFPMGKLKMPENSSSGICEFSNRQMHIKFTAGNGKRRIQCKFKDFYEGKPFSCDISLDQPPMDTMVIATPWQHSKAFYYNQKINCMRASGVVKFDGKLYYYHPEHDFGTLDWGRGVWTYDNTWYWGSGNGIVEGKPFGFNIGYGFGDTSAASENMLFYDGVGHKLEDVTFYMPAGDYLKTWTFSSSDGRFEMEFQPVIDRSAKTDIKFIMTDQHQVFGRMTGKAVLDDGKVLDIKNLMCFAEKVHNRY